MEIVQINSIKIYNTFIQKLYNNTPYFKDNKTDIVELICSPKGAFYSNSWQEMVGVLSRGQIQCQTVLIHHKNSPDVLMVALFEAKENADEEVEHLICYSKKIAKQLGCKKLSVALNGHCNYSIGFLYKGFDEPPIFGQSYNPAYYNEYFISKGFTSFGYTSYKDDITNIGEKLSKLTKHVSCKEIAFLHRNFAIGDFNKTMRHYTKLNNDIFCDHFYYFKREEREDKELFVAMRPLLKEDNLIFAVKNNEPVGFILWYHDYNELVDKRCKTSHNTVLKYTLLRQAPKTIIITEIGVYPEYENTGLILALFNELYKIVQKKYPKTTTVASSWVQNENKKSKKLVSFLLGQKSKEFVSYEINI